MKGEELKEAFLRGLPVEARLADTNPKARTRFERVQSIVYTRGRNGEIIVSAELADRAGCIVRVPSRNIEFANQ